jgi:hypothetical protein
MTTLIVHPDNNEKLKALKVVMKALKISFEEKTSPYDPEFVASILQAEQDIKNGKGVKIATEDLWK